MKRSLLRLAKAIAQEGEEHTWKNGQRMVKRGGKWVPVTQGKKPAAPKDVTKPRNPAKDEQKKQAPRKPAAAEPPMSDSKLVQEILSGDSVTVGGASYRKVVEGGRVAWRLGSERLSSMDVIAKWHAHRTSGSVRRVPNEPVVTVRKDRKRLTGGDAWFRAFGMKTNKGWSGKFKDFGDATREDYASAGADKAIPKMMQLRARRVGGDVNTDLVEALVTFAVTSTRTSAAAQERAWPAIDAWLASEDKPLEGLVSAMTALGNQYSRAANLAYMRPHFERMGEIMRQHPTDGIAARRALLAEPLFKGVGAAKVSFILELSGYDTACLDARVLQHLCDVNPAVAGEIASEISDNIRLYEAIESQLVNTPAYSTDDPQPTRKAAAQWRMWDTHAGTDTDHMVLWRSVSRVLGDDTFAKAGPRSTAVLAGMHAYSLGRFGASGTAMGMLGSGVTGGVPDGTVHTWKNGQRMIKRGGKWIPVVQAAHEAGEDLKSGKIRLPKTAAHLQKAKRVRVDGQTYERGADGWTANGKLVSEEQVLRDYNRVANGGADEVEQAPGPRAVVGETFSVPEIKAEGFGDSGPSGAGAYEVAEVDGDRVRIAGKGLGSVWMPKDSLRMFVEDLSGKITGPPNPPMPEIEAVLEGRATFLGKGDDGVAFRVGDRVVKVSTTVPFQPMNPFHRTPEQAEERARTQHEVVGVLREAGVRVLPEGYYEHGGRGYTVKPYLDAMPKRFTPEQLEEVSRAVAKMHAAGYAMNDQIQAGIWRGKVWLYDVGKAAKIKNATGIFSDVKRDEDYLRRMYADSGVTYEPHDAAQRAQSRFDRAIATARRARENFDGLEKLIHDAHDDLAKHLEGEDLEFAGADRDLALDWLHENRIKAEAGA